LRPGSLLPCGPKQLGSEPSSKPLGPPDAESDRGTITRVLTRHRREGDSALVEAVGLVYGDLQRIARRRLASERRTPTFDTESLIHEAYLRLAHQDRTQWNNRQHFFAVATRIMRRVLVDRARSRNYAKRGGGVARTTLLDEKELPGSERGLDVLALEDALTDLHHHNEELAQIVELRFFGGLTNPEIAEIQKVTPMTILRRWRLARAWLQRYLVRQHESR